MSRTYFTADTHFNHANVIKYCARPFAPIDEMNREMIALTYPSYRDGPAIFAHSSAR